MNTIITNIPGYQVNEYKIILTPHEELGKRIMTIQKDFIENGVDCQSRVQNNRGAGQVRSS